jgi:hypothetical protein
MGQEHKKQTVSPLRERIVTLLLLETLRRAWRHTLVRPKHSRGRGSRIASSRPTGLHSETLTQKAKKRKETLNIKQSIWDKGCSINIPACH